MGRALQAPSGCNGHVRCRRKARTACSTSGNLRPKPHGQRSFLPSFSDSSLPPYTTRKPALDVSLGWEPLAAFAAGLVEKSCCSRQFLLPDGIASHSVIRGLSPSLKSCGFGRYLAERLTFFR